MRSGNKRQQVGPRFASLFLALLLPTLAWFFAHFGYVPALSLQTLSRDGFVESYGANVYRYRILGRQLVLISDQLWTEGIAWIRLPNVAAVAGAQNLKFESSFYFSYVGCTGLFFVGTCVLLFRHLTRSILDRSSIYSVSLYFLVLAVMSSFVLTPYDTLGLFLLLLMYVTWTSDSACVSSLSIAVTLLGSLNRETHALALAASLVLLITAPRFRQRWRIGILGINCLVFVMVYVGLRIILGTEHGLVSSILGFGQGVVGWTGLAAWFVVLSGSAVLLRATMGGRSHSLLLLLFSSPYLVVILLSGYWIELRLVLPLVLMQILLCVTDTAERGSVEPAQQIFGEVEEVT